MSKSKRPSPQSVSQSTIPMQVVEAIANAEGVATDDLDPLYESVDPDALEALVASAHRDLSIQFTVHGHQVEVDGTGEARVR